jgi:hypothetical protein
LIIAVSVCKITLNVYYQTLRIVGCQWNPDGHESKNWYLLGDEDIKSCGKDELDEAIFCTNSIRLDCSLKNQIHDQLQKLFTDKGKDCEVMVLVVPTETTQNNLEEKLEEKELDIIVPDLIEDNEQIEMNIKYIYK